MALMPPPPPLPANRAAGASAPPPPPPPPSLKAAPEPALAPAPETMYATPAAQTFEQAPWEDDGAWEVTDPGHAMTAQPPVTQALSPIDFDTMSLEDIAKAQGFQGLNFNQYGILPICALNKGVFRLSDGNTLGDSFICRLQVSRPKYLYKPRLAQDDPRNQDPRYKVAYTYDHQTSNTKSLAGILDEWRGAGLSWEVKEYLECTAVLPDGRVILLSIPPTSTSRFLGHYVAVTMSRKLLAQVNTRVYKGPEVTKAKVPFDPICFEVAD